MADPFNAIAGAGQDPWQNLMAFGLATMAAGGQPGAKTLGALGQGGLAAMQNSREQAKSAAETGYIQSEGQAKRLANQIGLTQINYQRQLMGQPPLDQNGMPTQQQVPLTPPTGASAAGAPQSSTPSNSTGMPYQPTAGSSARTPQSFEMPSDTPAPATYSPSDINALLRGIYTGQIEPTPELARVVAPTAAAMNLPIAGKLQDLAYNPSIAGAEAQAKAPYEYHDVRAGGALFQGSKPVAYGGINAVAPDGTPYMMPPRAANGEPYGAPVGATTGAAPSGAELPIGIRNNNPTNLRPTGDQWHGQTGVDGGYMTFATPQDGIRAATINLQNYQQRGWNTPLSIAQHWAPQGDGNNDPKAYGMNLATMLGVDPGQPINLSDPQQASAVVHGLIHLENGMVPYQPQQIMSSVASGLGTSAPAAAGGSATNAALPPGAIQTGISPASAKYLEERGGDLGKKQGEWDNQAQGAVQNNFLLDQMRTDAQSWRMGKWADAEGGARKYLQGFATAMGADATRFDKPLGDYQAFQKSAGQLTREAVRQTSSKAAFQEFQLIQQQLPSAEMSKGGFDTIVNQMQSVNDYAIARQSAAQQWAQSHNNSLTGFEIDFNKNVTPATFLMQRMAQNNPADFKQMWSNLQKNPQGQRTLEGLVSKRNYALQNGLFE